ncbi:hypothetical protein GWI33_012760 [Rhynchophorus ferrugineus]|uniref:C2H2-type domain-containing protein n=1 Tax=Rhynchophorus ferrugineus TaxID=354439 RepID=A0A834IPJ2_RHYFE|nr:hypothetical protein GWI33_012760 [Rhynchophorus ferrugineus]
MSSYKHKAHLGRHIKYECGVQRQFMCPNCFKRFKHKNHLQSHEVSQRICCCAETIVESDTSTSSTWRST